MVDPDPILVPRKLWQKWWVWMLLFLVVVLFFILYQYLKHSQNITYAYVTQAVQKGDLELTVSATGYLHPLGSVDVGSEVSGTIKEVKVDFNQQVKKGDVLAVIDQTKYLSNLKRSEAMLQSAKAVLQSAEAELQLRHSNYERNKLLRKNSKGDLPSQKEWDITYAAYLSAKAAYESSKAKVQEAGFAYESSAYDLEHTVIYAPINGVVLIRNIDPGQTVVASFQTPVLFTLAADLKQMELQVSIDEADIAHIKMDQKALFSVDAYEEETFEAWVRSIRVNSEMVAGVVTYKALLSVDNSKLKLLPGMSADADIVTKAIKNVWIIPRAALLYMPVIPKESFSFGAQNVDRLDVDPKSHVWVEKNAEAIKVYVDILGTSGTQVAVNSEDLKEGDKVILSQEQRL